MDSGYGQEYIAEVELSRFVWTQTIIKPRTLHDEYCTGQRRLYSNVCYSTVMGTR